MMLRGPMVAYAPEGEDSGALSREQAVELLTERPEENPAPEAPAVAAAEPQEIEAEASPAEDPDAEPEQLAEGEAEAEAEPEAVAPVEPPKYWSQEAKAKFAELPPELQAVVLEQEGPREAATAKAKAEAAEQVKAAQKDVEGVQALATKLAEFLPTALETFQSRWGAQEPDWAAVAEEHGGDEAFKLKARFDAEQKQLIQLSEGTKAAQAEAHKAFVKAQWTALAQIAPELAPDVADPTKGAEQRQAVVRYLVEGGVPHEAIPNISAVEMTLAHKAMLWDQAQAAVKAKPLAPKPAAPVAKSPVRPAAAPAQSSPQRTAQALANRYAQTRSVDDAVALLLAKGAHQ